MKYGVAYRTKHVPLGSRSHERSEGRPRSGGFPYLTWQADPAPRRLHFVTKRVFDVVASLLLIVMASPIIVAAALAVALTSKGPVLFRQERVGTRQVWRDGKLIWETRPFEMLKLRSMYVDCDDHVHRTFTDAFVNGDLEATAADASGYAFKLARDPRVTPVGALLRRWSIDETPQFFNVLVGNMSLVGPRPALSYEVDHYAARHIARFGATPGITGLWQTEGRSLVPFEEMVRLDIDYVRRQSFLLDVEVLARTIPVLMSGRGGA